MEIRVPDFFRLHLRRVMVVVITLQLLVTCLAGAMTWILWWNGYAAFNAFVAGFGSLLVVQAVLTPLFIASASQSLRVISQAVAHVSKDPIQTTPPDLSPRRFERSGLRALVQTIYELAARPVVQAAPINNSGSLYDTMLTNAPVGLVALDDNGKIAASNKLAPLSTNPQGELTFDLQFETGQSIADWLADIKDKLRDVHLWSRVADKLPGQDNRHIYDVMASYNKGSDGGIDTVVASIDRTGQYAPYDEDMDFIALAAHELRGPVTVIRGYLDIASDTLGEMTADQQELIDRIKVSADQLSGYINNILNVSRFDRHHLQLHPRQAKLIDIFKDLLPGLILKAKTKKRTLSFFVPDTLPDIAADNSSLGEVIVNLIDNAIKYSPANGKIIIRAVQNGDFVEVTVQDFGIGIPTSIVGNLFTKFYRSHRSSQQVGGTGLGLYICKAVVESHGGHIWVRSQEGTGSTFGFTIPTYESVADKLAKGDNGANGVIPQREGWIKNHSLYLQ